MIEISNFQKTHSLNTQTTLIYYNSPQELTITERTLTLTIFENRRAAVKRQGDKLCDNLMKIARVQFAYE